MNELDSIREMIKTENQLINQRIGWLGMFQGLLFAVIAFGWSKSDLIIIYTLCSLGIFVGISIGIATFRANKTIERLEVDWDDHKSKDYVGRDVVGLRNRSGCLWWLMPGYSIPWAFVIAWVAIFVSHLYNR